MKPFRNRRSVVMSATAALAVAVAAGYGQAALSQTPAQTPAKKGASAKPLTLQGLAVRLTALEAENRQLRERVAQLEREPVIVPLSSMSQTAEGYAYYGMPLRGYTPQVGSIEPLFRGLNLSITPRQEYVWDTSQPNAPRWIPLQPEPQRPLAQPNLVQPQFVSPQTMSPYGPPPRILDARDVNGMMLLKAAPNSNR